MGHRLLCLLSRCFSFNCSPVCHWTGSVSAAELIIQEFLLILLQLRQLARCARRQVRCCRSRPIACCCRAARISQLHARCWRHIGACADCRCAWRTGASEKPCVG
jgi:hypothetical protein